MTQTTIHIEDLLPPIIPSSDPTYDDEGRGLDDVRFRFGLAQNGSLRVGCALRTGERFGYQFNGFAPTQKTIVGSAVAFRQGGVTLTFKLINGQVKERIRFATAAAAQARITIAIGTQDCHFEGAAFGGLVVWSDLSNTVIATVEMPTVADANGRSDCPARYELAPDGKSVDLVLDATWLAAAAFPVFVDPTTTITSTSINANSLLPNGDSHVFKLNDGSLVSFWVDNSAAAGNLRRSRSTDGGTTWGASSSPFGSIAVVNDGNVGIALCHDAANDIIVGLIATTADSTKFGSVIKMAWNGSSWTDTSLAVTAPVGAITSRWGGAAYFDPVFRRLIVVYSLVDSNFGNWRQQIEVYDATGALTFKSAPSFDTGPAGGDATAAFKTKVFGSTSGTPVVYVTLGTPALGTTLLRRYTFDGTTLTQTHSESTADLTNCTGLDIFVDASDQLEAVYLLSGALKHLKRTGAGTFSSVTTIKASGVVGQPSVGLVRNANADFYVAWRDNTSQANGEIRTANRIAGTFSSSALFAGGASTGWNTPSTVAVTYADGKVYMLYITGTGTPAVTFNDGLNVGTVPLAPDQVAPTGLANLSLTPTVSARYNNNSANDALSKYRVLVTRQSDSVVMWDTGSGGTAWGGATILPGGTFSIVYAGTGLAKGITYLLQLQFWDQVLGLAGPLNTAVTFQVNDAPAVGITSSASAARSGPTVTWSYSQTLGHAQVSYRVRVLNPGTGAVIHDSGTVSSAATSYALPNGTIVNGVAYTLEVTAVSSDGL